MRGRGNNHKKIVSISQMFIFKWRFRCLYCLCSVSSIDVRTCLSERVLASTASFGNVPFKICLRFYRYFAITLSRPSSIFFWFNSVSCILARWSKSIKCDNQIVVRYKQLIKIKKPFQCLVAFFIQRCWKKYSSDCFNLLSFFFTFYLRNVLQRYNNCNWWSLCSWA